MISVDELFGRCVELATSEPSAASNRFMHETLVLCCAGGMQSSEMAFGNLFSQVDYLTKRCGMTKGLRAAVQQMRRHSNHTEVLSQEEWMQDVRALAQFISAVFKADIPDALVRLIPHHVTSTKLFQAVNASYIRCIVTNYDEQNILADTVEGEPIEVDYTNHAYLIKILRKGMQLNLLDNHVDKSATVSQVTSGLIVVEPDFLLDISNIARCFQGNYGHHPLLYTTERLRPRGNSQAMLLGNFAGAALDDIIWEGNNYSLSNTMNTFFREQVLQFTTCEDFNSRQFIDDAQKQSNHIKETVNQLFDKDYDRSKALLEPSFVCERLGIQGRVDLMTSDMRLLVEQKSGKNYNLELNTQGIKHKEEHYVQLLLYYGILRYNFGRSDNQVDIRLLYSRYPAAKGLLYVNFYRELFHEAIRLRNQIVATELLIAREGFGRILPLLRTDVVFKGVERDGYFHRYVEPSLSTINAQLTILNPTERAYYERMLTFIYREQLLQKEGRQEGQGGAVSDLWNMPLTEKLETGNIILNGQLSATLNFRRGDMVYVYNYDKEPDVRSAILYKGTIESISSKSIKVRYNDKQQGFDPMSQDKWAIEHAASDMNTTSAIKSLHQFITSNDRKRALLLGGRMPEADTSLRLSRSYHPDYDDVLLRAKQSHDYFLLIGPPGTGKTSMALRFMVEEAEGDLLLMSYTNRAVDEICAMLDDAGRDYLRIGNETSCDPRFKSHLLENKLSENAKLDDIRQYMETVSIVVGTTSMLQARPFIFQLKHFSLCIVDEASQILEPGLVGLLSCDSIKRFILIGDHKQLPAVVQQSEEESLVDHPLLTAIGITNCRQSLFERLLHWERHCQRSQFIGILRKQGRMHPDIAAFPNLMFYPNEQLEPVPLKHQTDTSLHYDLESNDVVDDLLKQNRLLFIHSENPQQNGITEDTNFSDKTNPAEARIVADLLYRIHRFYDDSFNPDKTVGVIVPYRNQIAMIRQEIEKLKLHQLEQISIDTVERYQGSQRDVIIYSFTVSRPYQLDFLTSNCFIEEGRTIDRKLNVAITRARKQLIMTGNATLLCRNAIFKQLIASTKYVDNYGKRCG